MTNRFPDACVAKALSFLFPVNKKQPCSARRLWLPLLGLLVLVSCGKRVAIPFNPEFAQYVAAFTSGNISAAGTIRVRLTESFAGQVETGVPLKDKLLAFSPSLEGELVWVDDQTLEFTPSAWLKRGPLYEATLHLGDIVADVPENLSEFVFSFQAMNQGLSLNVRSITPYKNDDLRWMQLSGSVQTADVAEPAALSEVVSATQDGRELRVSWTFNMETLSHSFVVDSIARTEKDGSVSIKWNGKSIGADAQDAMVQEIPALGNFKVFFFAAVQQPEQYIQLQFSDPLDPAQDLRGLITIQDMESLKFTITGNEVKVYPPYRISGEHTVTIHTGISNIMGFKNTQKQELQVSLEELKPDIEIPDPGKVILPSTDGLVFPFRAVNLHTVDVRVIRIFESNIPQFLQVNDLAGKEEIRRVGRSVKSTSVKLNNGDGKNLGEWNTFYLDLEKLIKAEPGAVYRVELSMKQAYSLYHCGADSSGSKAADANMTELADAEEYDEDESSYWDASEGYYYDDYYDDYYGWDYDWDERDNPCSASYFKHRRPEGKNLLASDIGIIAKKGNNNAMLFAITDMLTTKPLAGADLSLLNYQQQPIATAKTDAAGMAALSDVKGTPFLVVVKQGKQRGYLKMDGNHALSTSTFDTYGAQTQKGLKGFIYGERGVWRPGDTLFLNFMLEDEKRVIPAAHPVNFELVNPRGQVVQKMVRTRGENGFFNFTSRTDSDAETGNYTANVRVGGAVFSKTLKIETIKPNRLKLALDFGKEKITTGLQSVSGNLSARWLHGAVAKNLKANVSATFTKSKTVFEKYADYAFDDPTRDFTSEEQGIFDGRIDAAGNAKVDMKVDLKDRAPGMLTANFSVKVFEEGGDFSVDRFSIPYAPYDYFVGLKVPKGDRERQMLLTDENHAIQVLTLDADGKPVKRDSLRWTVHEVRWRWWWETSGDDLSNYTGSGSMVPLQSGQLSTSADGKGSFTLNIKYPEWGRYLIRVEDPKGGHATGQTVYVDWPGWAGRAQRENPGGASMLTFSLDKTQYTTGDKCTVTFPSSAGARALVTIENGTEVLEAKWVETRSESTSYSFTTDTRMTPNAYVHISLLQPHNQTANDLPIRLYGVMPLFVENPGSHLQPVITMASELEPEKKFDVRVSEKSGKAMTYTLAIVDEGLLDLTRFKTPDPWNHFYAREALGVNTYDMYDEVIGAFGARLEKLLSLGGDGESDAKGSKKANRFKPVGMFAGPFSVEAGKAMSHNFTMPNYVGSVRVMVIAGRDLAYGNAEKSVPVKKPLMVLATLPRVLGPGEDVTLPVNVFAMDKKVKEVNVRVEPNDLFSMTQSSSQTVRFSEPGDEVVNFSLRVKDKVGVGNVKVTVSGGGYSATHQVELNVRNANPPVTQITEGLAEPGKTWSGTFDLVGISGTNSTSLEISAIPPVNLGRRLKYLLEYPHGCVEQTVSGAFPQLFMADVMELGTAEKNKTTENIKFAINRLAKFVLRNGAFTYWPGENAESLWGTNYAGHFFLEAEAKGYTLPAGWKSSWTGYQKTAAQNWRRQGESSGNYYWREDDLVQAYRLYTLALAGQADLGAMNRLKEDKLLSTAAGYRLAAAYALAGQTEVARQLISRLPSTIAPYQSMGYTYGSQWRDYAMMIETLVITNDRLKAAPLVKELAAHLSSSAWCSTQETAYGLMAISKFAGGEPARQIRYISTLNGKAGPERVTDKPLSSQTIQAQAKGNRIEVKNNGSALVYIRVINTGQPAAGNETASASNLSMGVRYLSMTGQPLNVGQIEQGTDFVAEVTVTHPGVRGRYDELALTQVFPSGWEIINSRMDISAMVIEAQVPEYQDFRDDRVYSYFDLYRSQSKVFRVKLNATYLGRYYLPAMTCEAMYDNSIAARTGGQWVNVVPASGGLAQQ